MQPDASVPSAASANGGFRQGDQVQVTTSHAICDDWLDRPKRCSLVSDHEKAAAEGRLEGGRPASTRQIQTQSKCGTMVLEDALNEAPAIWAASDQEVNRGGTHFTIDINHGNVTAKIQSVIEEQHGEARQYIGGQAHAPERCRPSDPPSIERWTASADGVAFGGEVRHLRILVDARKQRLTTASIRATHIGRAMPPHAIDA